jgi:hypothetical protein
VGLDPRRSFPGSSRIVPVLTRFVSAGPAARAVVIDGNPTRGGQVVGFLKKLGYDPQLVETGEGGFRIAAESADVELVAMDPSFLQGSWRLIDAVANFRADAHTAGLPLFVYGPLPIVERAIGKLADYPEVRGLVLPTEAGLFKGELDRGLARLSTRPLSAEERADYAKQAAALLVRIATRPGSPFESDLPIAVPALVSALNNPAVAPAAASALGDAPRIEAQRSLADAVLNPSNTPELRLSASEALARSLRRFGPLLAADHETRLVDQWKAETDPGIRNALAAVVGTLRSRASAPGRTTPAVRPPSSPTPTPTSASPGGPPRR